MGGTDPIPAAASVPAGSLTCFLVYNTSNQSCVTATETTLEWPNALVNQGGGYTTSDDQTFTLVEGVWLVGLELVLNLTAAGTWTGFTSAQIKDGGGTLKSKKPFPADSVAHQGGQFGLGFTRLVDGSTIVDLNASFFNAEGYTINVLSGGDTSYMWGVLLG